MFEQYATDKTILNTIIVDFMNSTDAGTCMINLDSGKVIYYNEAFKKDVCLYEGIKRPGNMSIYEFTTELIPGEMRERMCVGGAGFSSKWEIYVDRHKAWFDVVGKMIHWTDGGLYAFLYIENITSRKEEEEHLHYIAYNDKRLNIPNGHQLFDDISSLEYDRQNFMISFNVQGLRNINNLYGREAGDTLLKVITCWASLALDGRYEVYRLEKDDFVILINDADELSAMNIARFLYNRFSEAWIIELNNHAEQEIYAGAYMGVIEIEEKPQTYEQMQSIDEKVMTYARKENRLILFDEEMNKDLEELLRFEEDLKTCILNNMQGFSLNYQPIVEARTGNWIGAEALCRWNRPRFGPVSPDMFILETERLGFINILTKWVLKESVSQAKKWNLDKTDFILDVNLSPIQLKDRDLLDQIREVLDLYDYPANKLSLEITESAEVQFDEITLCHLDSIKQLGVSLSLDDFGTGYSSLSNLRILPVDVLKTDRSFMKGIEDDEYLQDTIKIMVEFARAAKIKIVAEGVETKEQCDILKEKGVSMIQGYYFSRPLTKEKMDENLHRFANRQ